MSKRLYKGLVIYLFVVCMLLLFHTDIYAAEIKYSGTSGDLNWSIDSDGVLRISGSGDYEISYIEEKIEDGYTTAFYAPKWCKYHKKIKKAIVNVKNITSTETMFSRCENLETIDFQDFDTSNVVTMKEMFYGCSKLKKLDVSGFNTEKVSNMSDMFIRCSLLEVLDVSHFNTKNVEDMSAMFCVCKSVKYLDVSKFDTKKVTDMSDMFGGCESLEELDVSHFDTRAVSNLSGMFEDCSSLKKLDVSGFFTKNVVDMSFMFSGCKQLKKIDVSSFDTTNVFAMDGMFQHCKSVKVLNTSGFYTENVTDMGFMFSGCYSLESLDLSGFNTQNVEDMEYMFQHCHKIGKLDLGGFIINDKTVINRMFVYCYNVSANINVVGNVKSFAECFYEAATASDAAIYVTYGGNCSRALAKKIVATKSSDSHVYLKEAVKVKELSFSNVSDGIKLSWKKQGGADGYQIYRKAPGESSYTRVKTTSAASFTDKSVTRDEKYSYKVRAYITVDGKKSYGSYSDVGSYYRLETAKLSSVTNLKSGVKLSWSKMSGVDGYYVYRKLGSESYKKVATIESFSTKTWTDKDVESGKKYTYAVAVYKDGSAGCKSSGKEICFLKAVEISDVNSPEKGKIKLSWKSKDGISGYEIDISQTSDFSKDTISTKVDANYKSVVAPSMVSGRTYYVRIRCYKKVGEKTYYSAWSSVKSCKAK